MKKNILTTAVLLVLGILFLAPATSHAWGVLNYGFYWTADEASYDKIEGFIVAGPVQFGSPGFVNYGTTWNFTLAGWTVNTINPTYTLAAGVATTNLNFDFNLLPPQGQYFTMDMVYWLNGAVSWWGKVGYGGGPANGWFSNPQPLNEFMDNYNRNPIPEPGTLLLLGTGMLGFGVIARYRRNKKA